MVLQTHPGGWLDINDLEMSLKLLAWLVLEGIVGIENLRYKQVGLFIDNTSAVSWTKMGAANKSAAAWRLLGVLSLWKQVSILSPLVTAHVAGDLNVLGGISSRSFGYSKQWHCTNNSEFLSLINYHFPLPHQRSWQGLGLFFVLSTKVISKLGTKAYTMGEWKWLRKIGGGFRGSGLPIANPSELTHTWRKSISKPKQGLQQDLQATCKK